MKVGDRVKGFKFVDGTDGVELYSEKEFYIGKEGVVKYISNRCFAIQFENDYWEYPISLAHLAQIEWQPKQGDMIEVSDNGDNWYTKEFIAKVDKFNYPYIVIASAGFTIDKFKHARPINSIQREIEELEEKIKELKAKL